MDTAQTTAPKVKIRQTPLLVCLLITGVALVIVSILQLSVNYFGPDMFARVVITIGILGSTASFTSSVEFDLPSKRRKLLLGADMFIGTFMMIFIAGQMWFNMLSASVFSIVLIAGLVLLGLLTAALIALEDFHTTNPKIS